MTTFWCCSNLFGQHFSVSKIDSIELTDTLEKKNLFIDNFYVNRNIIIIQSQHKLTIYTPDLNFNNTIQFKKARKDDKILYVDSLIIKLSRRKIELFNMEFESISKFKHELKEGYFLNKVVGNRDDFHLLYEKRPEKELETPKLIAIRIKELKIYETKTFFDIQFPKHFKFSLYNKNISSNHILVSNVGDPKIYHFDHFFNSVDSFGVSTNITRFPRFNLSP